MTRHILILPILPGPVQSAVMADGSVTGFPTVRESIESLAGSTVQIQETGRGTTAKLKGQFLFPGRPYIEWRNVKEAQVQGFETDISRSLLGKVLQFNEHICSELIGNLTPPRTCVRTLEARF